MSIVDYAYSTAQNALLAVLSAGPIPPHIAFVMDGNRRYARLKQKAVWEGHTEGFNTLHRVLDVCLRLGVQCVTVYAFSIENFKRSEDEVNALMDLAEKKLLELSRQGELLDRYGVRLNVIGMTELLPVNVLTAARKAEDLTKNNSRAILNLCMPYASRHEMAVAVQEVVQDAIDTSHTKAISEADIEAKLMITKVGSPPLDVLIRTSGVKRLSDFMLWQSCENTQIHMIDTYWPDFGLRDFIPILLDYQRKFWSRQIAGK